MLDYLYSSEYAIEPSCPSSIESKSPKDTP